MTLCHFRPVAWRDLASIIDYIGQENPQAAAKVADEIQSTCEGLAAMPGLGYRRDFTPPNVRVFPVGSYVIYYKVLDSGIEIQRIVHSSRLQEAIRFH